MNGNQKISERKYAASLVRRYFNGEISRGEILSSFPDYQRDFKMWLLYNHIIRKPKKGGFFGISKEKFEKFILKAYEIIEDLETDKLSFKTMKTLFRQLSLQSNECTEPNENIGNRICEVCKITSNFRGEIMRYLNLLIEKLHYKNIRSTISL